MAATKTCNTCEATKPVGEFQRERRNPDGRRYICKACTSDRAKAWRKANPDKVRERNQRHYREHREKMRAESLATYRENRDEINAERRRAYAEDPDRRQRAIAYFVQWQKDHPEKVRSRGGRRRARKLALPYEDVDTALVFERDEGTCGICGGPCDPDDWHLDHIVPLARGGHHTYDNVQVAHPACNLKKGAKILPMLSSSPQAA